MKIKNLKIGTQLILSFSFMLVFVISLGLVAYRESKLIYEQTETLYNHPLKVRKAIGGLITDVLRIRANVSDYVISKTETENKSILNEIAISESDANKQINTLRSQFLGSQIEVDEVEACFIKWNLANKATFELHQKGEIDKVLANLSPTGSVGILREQLMKEIHDIDEYASKKAESLYMNSSLEKESLDRQLIFLVLAILALMALISYFLIKNLTNNINELTEATKRFKNGDLNARSSINSKNEFGELSNTLNSMVQQIQETTEQGIKTAEIAELMLSEEEPKKFFTSLLPALAHNTNSQMAAVYLLSADKKEYQHFHSFGMDSGARNSFAVESFEGEFGSVLSTGKIQTVERIPKDSRFLFHTVSGKLVPREIISIPILNGKEIVAIISLASIRSYSPQSELLIHNIHDTLSARVSGVLSYQKLQELLKKLEYQNTELESQKTEMVVQSEELKEQNRELEIQKIQLNEANRMKTNFLSNMSHELRTPLNSVIALSGVLNRRLVNKIPADEYSYLEVIERNGKNLLELINDILDISRIEAGHEETEITKFSTNNLLTELITMIQPQAKQKHIKLIQSEINQTVTISSDEHKCRHILQNLISNAVKFTEKGQVEVSVIQKNSFVKIAISDTGIGIEEHNLKHIFEEFRQADASTSRRYGGTGLGLAIALKYANLLGGTIEVTSSPGMGSTFTLTLPLEYDGEIITHEESVSNNDFAIRTKPTEVIALSDAAKTILIVDDSEPAIIQMKDFLLESGYKIQVAHNGTEALGIINQMVPDAMILDLMMPGIDGFKVLETIRNAEVTALIPVLVLTAKHITKEDLKNLKRNNIHQLIQKGDVSRTELIMAIDTMFSAPQKLSENQILPIQKIVGKPKLLVVEDNQDNMVTVKAVIGDKFDILEAVDGEEALQMATKHLPHLILMDISLPGMDGIQTFFKLRQIDELQKVPVIALTASAMTSDRETILAQGFDGYIGKPIDEKEFFLTIDKILYGK